MKRHPINPRRAVFAAVATAIAILLVVAPQAEAGVTPMFAL